MITEAIECYLAALVFRAAIRMPRDGLHYYTRIFDVRAGMRARGWL